MQSTTKDCAKSDKIDKGCCVVAALGPLLGGLVGLGAACDGVPLARGEEGAAVAVSSAVFWGFGE